MSEDFYRAFEAKFRGSREVIKQRLEVYIPFIKPLKNLYPDGEVLDLGCGRGEWLELMNGLGFKAVGIDLNQGMLDSCLEFGLNGIQGDALEYLACLDDDSQVVISAFHLVEHISFEQLQLLVKQSLRVLKPGGLLILETPNSENIRVATQSFYLDPTHLKPVPSLQLSFLTEYVGFKKNKVIRLQEERLPGVSSDTQIRKVINGVSQDYAVIAQKEITHDLYGPNDNPFAQSYGLSIDEVVQQYDININNQKAVLENQIQHLQTEYQQLHNEFIALFSSRSWRMTKPMRLIGEEIRLWKRNLYGGMKSAKLKMKLFTSRFINWIKRYPHFYEPLKKLMQTLGIFNLLKNISGRKNASVELFVTNDSEPWVPSAHISSETLKIMAELKSHLSKGEK